MVLWPLFLYIGICPTIAPPNFRAWIPTRVGND
jgi:hypothetical protein